MYHFTDRIAHTSRGAMDGAMIVIDCIAFTSAPPRVPAFF